MLTPINKKQKIVIICIDNTAESVAIRGVADSYDALAQCYFIGNVIDYIDLINSQPSDSIIIISAHGSKDGTTIQELGAEIELTMPYKRVITPANYQEFLKLDGQIIINNSCCGATLAKTFLNCGASHYIGADDYVDGNASLYFVVSLMYNLLCLKLSVDEAYIKAVAHDNETQMFKLFSRK